MVASDLRENSRVYPKLRVTGVRQTAFPATKSPGEMNRRGCILKFTNKASHEGKVVLVQIRHGNIFKSNGGILINCDHRIGPVLRS